MKTIAFVLSMMCAAGAASANEDKLAAARMLIFDRDWPKAVEELRRVVADRKEPLRDQAQYWLAHSLFNMDRTSDAIAVIEQLEREYPESRWVVQAHSLRVDIATRTGRPDLLWRFAVPPATPRPAPAPPRMTPRHPTPRAATVPGTTRPAPPEAPRPPAMVLTNTDVQIQALGALILVEPDRAIPELREIVLTQQETPQARRALFALSLSPEPEARETVLRVAQHGPEPLRVAAVHHIARWGTPQARTVLTTAYATGSERVKLEVLHSLGDAGAAGYIYELVAGESNPALRESGIYRMAAARGRPQLARLYARPRATREDKIAIINALLSAKGDRELVTIARSERDATLKALAVSKLAQLDTPVAKGFLGSKR